MKHADHMDTVPFPTFDSYDNDEINMPMANDHDRSNEETTPRKLAGSPEEHDKHPATAFVPAMLPRFSSEHG
jgi:hypothetical protein